ncbi:MAG TPA: hypothetical protein VGC21_17405, partial [Telluria sp.]
MNKCTLLFLLSLAAITPAFAAADEVAVVLEQQRQHGFGSPVLAIEALSAAGTDIGQAPLDLRMRYH